ncbi:MAG: phage tail tape measure protein [Novosphingobium sp.]|nr:phage tail tape measure protein [Novosphingobium sp.]
MDRDLRLKLIFAGLDKLSGPIRGISSNTQKLTRDMRETTAAIRKLEKSQGAINTFRSLKKEMASTGRELENARKKSERLGRELAQTDKPTAKLRREFAAAKREVTRLENRFEQQNRTLRTTRRQLSEAGIDTKNLAKHQRDLTGRVKKANQELETQKKRLQQVRDANERAQKLKNLGGKISGVGARASIGITAPVVAVGASSFQAATDAMELESAFEVTFGNSAKRMKAWAENTGNTMQRSTQEMMAMAMAYQDILKKQVGDKKAVDMTKSLTVLTQDLASFKNLSNEVAQQKIFSGLIGEAEPLRAVGVLLSDAAVQAKANQMGLEKVGGKFTEGSKVVARFALIQEQLADASGDVLRTQDSTANKLKAANAAWDELKVKVGEELLPKLNPVIDKITTLLDRFTNLPEGLQTFIISMALIAALAGPILIGVGGLVAAFGALAGGAAAVGIGLAPLIGIVLAIAAVVGGAAYLIYNNWGTISSGISEALAPVMNIVSKLGELFMVLWNGPLGQKLKIAGQLVMAIGGVIVGILGGTAMVVVETFGTIAKTTFDIIGHALDFIIAILNGDFAGAWEAIKGIALSAIEGVVSIIQGFVGNFKSIGSALIDGLIAGFQAGFDLVKLKVSELASFIPDWLKKPLGINSPSKVFMHLGGSIPQGLAVGIDRGSKVPKLSVRRMATGVAGAMALSTPAMAGSGADGSQAGNTYNFTIKAQPGESLEALARRIMTLIEELERKKKRGSYRDA